VAERLPEHFFPALADRSRAPWQKVKTAGGVNHTSPVASKAAKVDAKFFFRHIVYRRIARLRGS